MGWSGVREVGSNGTYDPKRIRDRHQGVVLLFNTKAVLPRRFCWSEAWRFSIPFFYLCPYSVNINIREFVFLILSRLLDDFDGRASQPYLWTSNLSSPTPTLQSLRFSIMGVMEASILSALVPRQETSVGDGSAPPGFVDEDGVFVPFWRTRVRQSLHEYPLVSRTRGRTDG